MFRFKNSVGGTAPFLNGYKKVSFFQKIYHQSHYRRIIGLFQTLCRRLYLFLFLERLNSWTYHSYYTITNTPMEVTTEQLEVQIAELNGKLTGDMFSDMDIKDEIHNLTMKLNGVKPMDSSFDCIGCGS